MSVQLAARAEQEALQAQQRLQEAEQEKQAVQAQLESVSEVVEQQQEELKMKEVQVGQLQQVVVDTRKYSQLLGAVLGGLWEHVCMDPVSPVVPGFAVGSSAT
jgi:multidrug efflux pump subunit AcrA (membrane-fusion protein)